jgi:hypothetical protein
MHMPQHTPLHPLPPNLTHSHPRTLVDEDVVGPNLVLDEGPRVLG